MKTRVEFASIGSMEVPEEAYYGVQTLRAKRNFPITNRCIHEKLIVSLADIKKVAAITNKNFGYLKPHVTNAIINACDEIICGKFHEQFILDPIQGGAGTSANMNANEVIANRAIEFLGGEKGDYSIIHPNDVFPTAGKLSILKMLPETVSELQRLYKELEFKALEFNDVIKMGRTQLQDAVPIRLG